MQATEEAELQETPSAPAGDWDVAQVLADQGLLPREPTPSPSAPPERLAGIKGAMARTPLLARNTGEVAVEPTTEAPTDVAFEVRKGVARLKALESGERRARNEIARLEPRVDGRLVRAAISGWLALWVVITSGILLEGFEGNEFDMKNLWWVGAAIVFLGAACGIHVRFILKGMPEVEARLQSLRKELTKTQADIKEFNPPEGGELSMNIDPKI